ncbi:sensor histidine kinase [Streptomyces aidingensis]|uniref:histidine kinase n=1 Tax=Streptomyces aidingensis TaxID=910347 RepID=A0A1I1UZ94_9ACTN|nr:sensor histidine kinase [Streptomyces aidingensis]SFD76142.1 Signal transduction histidine kinase [Streptomyces aidingensis]
MTVPFAPSPGLPPAVNRAAALAARLRLPHPLALDLAVTVAVLCAAWLQCVFPADGRESVSPLGWVLAAGTALPLLWRRRAPFAVCLAVGAATTGMGVHHQPPPDVLYGGLVIVYTLAAAGRPWQRRFALVAWLVGTSAVISVKGGADPIDYGFHLLGVGSAYGIGVLTRVKHAYAQAAEDRARRAEREREIQVARAAALERARIARDMHDILAHAVSLMVVQAEAGPVVVRSDPARAEAAFDAIAGTGRDAMAQLRRILGVLKDGDGSAAAPAADGPGPGPGTGGPPRAPQPTVADLPELVRQVTRSTGLRTELHTSGEPRPLPADTEVAVYRVVQEALTNTVKHAGARTVRVELDWEDEDDMLVLTVADDGRGPAGTVPAQGGGNGLVNIRERAAACGGRVRTGPGPDGRGFRVVARLPAAGRRRTVA